MTLEVSSLPDELFFVSVMVNEKNSNSNNLLFFCVVSKTSTWVPKVRTGLWPHDLQINSCKMKLGVFFEVYEFLLVSGMVEEDN